MMKNKNLFTRIIVSAAILLTISACTSTPEYFPYRITSDDGLVLIPTIMDTGNTISSESPRGFSMHFTGIDEAIEVENSRVSFVAVKVSNNRQTLEMISSKIINSDYHGSSSSDDVGYSLPYVPGEITVADFMFAQIISRSVQNFQYTIVTTISVSTEFQATTDEIRQQVMELVKSDPEYAVWFRTF